MVIGRFVTVKYVDDMILKIREARLPFAVDQYINIMFASIAAMSKSSVESMNGMLIIALIG